MVPTRTEASWPFAAMGVVSALAVTAMGAMEFSGAFGVLEDYSPVSVYTACLGVAAAVGAVVWCWRGFGRDVWVLALPVLAVICYLVAEAASYVTSHLDASVTGEAVMTTLKLVAYVAVICLLCIRFRSWHWAGIGIVAPMAVISLLGLVNEFLLHDRASFAGFETVTDYLGVGVDTARHAGPLPDPNFWGRFLVVGLPMAMALTHRAWRDGRRWLIGLAAVSVVLLLGGIYLTGSRGSFLACAVAVAAYLVCVGITWRQFALVGALGALLLLIPGVGSRLLSFGLQSPYTQRAAEDASALSRLATQRVALQMGMDKPLTGVGPGGYFAAFGEYAAQGQVTIDRVLAAHNLYLGLWAQTGILGLLGFGAILAAGLGLSGRALWLTRGMTRSDRALIRPYAAAIFTGILAWSAASVFLHLAYARIVLFMVCLAAAMFVHARRMPQVSPRRLAPLVVRRLVLGIGGAALVGTVAVAAVMIAPHGSTATRVGHLVPARPHDTYLINLRTRTALVPTYAVMIDVASDVTVDAQGDPKTGLVTVTAAGADDQSAARAVQRAVDAGTQAMARSGMDTVFTLTWLNATQTAPRAAPVRVLIGAGLGGSVAGAAAGMVAAAWLTRRAGRRDSKEVPG